MAEEGNLQGWAPEIRDAATLADVVDRAFDYRGDVTLVRTDGTEIVGYLSNRDPDASEPYVQMFEASGGGGLLTIPYRDIRAIRFTGRDTAAGNSYAAWLRTREAAPPSARSSQGV